MKPKLLISACLCGRNTKYNGKNNKTALLDTLSEKFELVLICPEVEGGLSTPRDPSEIREGRVYSSKGKDVTKAFQAGAEIACHRALKEHIQYALLKEASPSCGSKEIYDGSFSGVKIQGQGMTTRLLQSQGILVYNEHEIDQLLRAVDSSIEIY